ncbi:MAG: inorganic pyrophosphatase [Halioglobus sp.]|jgi:inorganic pyrophosphatase|nr:inorganic diphosphatase [marine gamma proteobacterium HTCC2148]MBT3411697.1 inorganic pyrophosphatase [Halieaceae bacterium]MDG1387343.1 inorganic pyrophosphatase [Halioglobus sp.]MBT5005579.1 inorganic pyrophosphatase [Halieaceae bacterium]MBT6125275.1 inorganic pyrophosphatase [Halieaceae bacterium]
MYSNRDFNRWRRHPWHGLHIRADEAPEDVLQVYIEMTPDDVVKYELDKASGFLMVDRPQRTTSSPPALYGFLPRTYCAEEVAKMCPSVEVADGDPLDICVFSERHITRADIVLNARVVGGIQMIDDGEADDKIIAVLEGDNIWGDVKDIADLPSIKTERLQHYFSTYKMIPGKDIEICVDHVYGRDEALRVIAAAEKDYWNHYGHLHEQAKAKE